MNDNYILMHKDIPCGVLSVDRDSGALADFTATEKEYVPFLGNADARLMKIWWNHRAVPGSRRDMEDAIRKAGCENNLGYLARNLALSLTDTYWVCPADIVLSWDDINLFRLCGTDQKVLSYHNGTSYDPNASLGGQMNKYWDVSGSAPVLVKKAYEFYGQQSINETFASEIHSRQPADIPFAMYCCKRNDDNAVLASCKAFTSEKTELVSAYEVLRSRKLRKNRSDCDSFIDICEEHGLRRDIMQTYMDYLILSDFAISNIDEHLQNFGLLRDTDTMCLIGPAPIFDSGNSMFYNINGNDCLSREDLLAMEISSLHNREEKMLRHVSDRHILDETVLPTPEETYDFYCRNGIPESRAHFIAASYTNKLSLLHDFQKGRSISLFSEKHVNNN